MSGRHIIIDPYVLALPASPAGAQSYVDGLQEWLPLLAQRRSECSVVERAVAILVEDGRFPTFPALKSLLGLLPEDSGVSIVDLRNLLRVVAESEPFFEHHVGLRSVAIDRITVDPIQVSRRLGENLETVINEVLAMTGLSQAAGWSPDGVYWASTEWPYSGRTIHAEAVVSAKETICGECEETTVVTSSLVGILTASAELSAITELAETYRHPALAVSQVLQRLKALDDRFGTAVSVRTGADFVSSIERHGIHRRPGVLNVLFERAAFAAVGALETLPGAKLHPYRVSSAGDAPQVVRHDGARLWRCMVTKSGAGYRLHYWSFEDGAIELDSVRLESE